MKKIVLFFLFCVAVSEIMAQTTQETKTISGNKKPNIGYFINPFCQVGKIAGPTAVMPGIVAGIILNDKISLGITYKYIATENTPDGEMDNRLYLDQRYAGIKCEYTIGPEKIVHLNFPVEAGIGETELDLKDAYEAIELLVPQTDAWFAYFEPGAGIEINLWKYLKLDFTASYRFISDVHFRNLSGKDFMGFNFSAGLKIGIF